MASILPVSDLRNYNEVLKNCHKGEPVYLNTVNLYELHRDTGTRLKMWGMVARTALHYDKKFPTDDRLQLFADSLEEHYTNMVNKELEHSDMNKVSQLVSDFETVLSSDDLERLKADIVLAGLV
ncbi:hypothetical protein [Streptococcus alactolyticus]|uniref:hypothetical protein n=1 Tax=Streptococcus alactolyticus TaxID=29389 RepID=UPI003F9C3330